MDKKKNGCFEATVVNEIPPAKPIKTDKWKQYNEWLKQVEELEAGKFLQIGGDEYTRRELNSIASSLRKRCAVAIRKNYLYLSKKTAEKNA